MHAAGSETFRIVYFQYSILESYSIVENGLLYSGLQGYQQFNHD